MKERKIWQAVGRPYIDLTGLTFGRLTVIGEAGHREWRTSRVRQWVCRCNCGNEVVVTGQNLQRKGTQSCGCLAKELSRQRIGKSGSESPAWRGGKSGKQIYRGFSMPNHPRANVQGIVREHIFVAEKALGHTLPQGAVVHHVDGDRKNNINTNLVICQDARYHSLLHRRTRALRESGHAHWAKCVVCKQWDDPSRMFTKENPKFVAYHNACNARYQRDKKAQQRQEAMNGQ